MIKLLSTTFTLLFITAFTAQVANATDISNKENDMPEKSNIEQSNQSIVLAGGCFWGVQAVFEHLKGVKQATSGYAGGSATTAHYEIVSSGMTGHAESVKVVFDPKEISLDQLLKVYFTVVHNPTELNHQGPDTGTQYRSAIFYSTADQQRIAQDYIKQLEKSKVFDGPIVTEIEQLHEFYPAEHYHQDYVKLNPDNPYVIYNDIPKVKRLKEKYPELYVEKN